MSSYTLLVASPLFADKRKCTVNASSLEELISNVKLNLAINENAPLELSLMTNEGKVGRMPPPPHSQPQLGCRRERFLA